VGRQRRLVLGKHSGTHGVKYIYGQMGISIHEREMASLLERIRQFALATKCNPGMEDLMRLYLEEVSLHAHEQ